MFFRKRLLVSALALSFLSVPVLAQLSLNTGSITSTASNYDRLHIVSPQSKLTVGRGEPVPLDFSVGNVETLQSIQVNSRRISVPRLYAGDRFQGQLLGATEDLGTTIIRFQTYSWKNGVTYKDVEIQVSKGSQPPSEAPNLNISSPTEGEMLQQGEPLTISFIVPNEKYKISGVEANGKAIDVDWSRLPSGSRFQRHFYGLTAKPGQLTVSFNYARVADGKTYNIEKNLNVLRSQSFTMEVISPSNFARYNQGDTMPIEAVPSSVNDNPRFVAYVNNAKVGEMTQDPYRYDYLVPLELGRYTVKVEEYNKDTYLNEKSVPVEFMPSARQIKTTLEIKNGTSAIPSGNSVTILADLKGYLAGKEVPNSEFEDKIEAVEFYVNDELASRDETPPYEFTKQYLNNQSSLDRYATPYRVQTKVKMRDSTYQAMSPPAQKIEAVPSLGANYCSIETPNWNASQPYQRDDIVQDKGFFYRSNTSQQGSQPKPSFNPYNDNPWTEILCSNQIITQTGINIMPKGQFRAQIGQNVDINGQIIAADPKYSLDRLVKLDSNSGAQTQIPTTSEGNFSFSHLFKGESRCFGDKCDTIDLYAINDLGYSKKTTIAVKENAAPTIGYAYAQLDGNTVMVNFYGEDDGAKVTASIYDNSGTLIVSEDIQLRPSFIKNTYAGVLTFKKPSGTTFLFEVKDNAGSKVTKTLTLK